MFHEMALGHDINHCMEFKNVVQELMDYRRIEISKLYIDSSIQMIQGDESNELVDMPKPLKIYTKTPEMPLLPHGIQPLLIHVPP